MASFESQFWTSRDFHASARLHLQHWLFQETLGFLLHPSIEINGPEVAIADIACGNGAWLNAVSHQFATSTTKVQLHGFDIATSAFPAREFRPSNVHVHELDVLSADLPAEWGAKFEVVHIRAFSSLIKNNDTGPLLRTASQMLKPGGWLQWDEVTTEQMTAKSPAEGVSKEGCDALLELMSRMGDMVGLKHDWRSELGDHLKSHDVTMVDQQYYDDRPDLYKAWTEDYLIVYEDVISQVPTAEKAGPNAPLTKETYAGMVAKAIEECGNGVVMHAQKIMVAVGRKTDSNRS